MNTFGDILRKLRGDRTQEQIAVAVGITKSSWAMYERGERIPRDEVKIKIAAFFGKTVQDIFFTQSEHI
jgi:DNA-binding XRE family transcriptional regulator